MENTNTEIVIVKRTHKKPYNYSIVPQDLTTSCAKTPLDLPKAP